MSNKMNITFEKPARSSILPLAGVVVAIFLVGGLVSSRTASGAETQSKKMEGSAPEVIVYMSDLSSSALYEFDFQKESSSPGEKMAITPNKGDELDPPPENDPHIVFKVNVRRGIPYRAWIHMKVGRAKGKSQANMVWVQFSDAADKANKEVLRPGTSSYLTAQGPTREGWTWVGCNGPSGSSSDNLIYFRITGDVTVRIQAGMEGVGFDQFLLSPARFLEKPPTEAVVRK